MRCSINPVEAVALQTLIATLSFKRCKCSCLHDCSWFSLPLWVLHHWPGCVSVRLCVCLSVYLSVCQSVRQHETWHADVADALKASLQEAKAEAQRVRDCQAQLSRQHQVL